MQRTEEENGSVRSGGIKDTIFMMYGYFADVLLEELTLQATEVTQAMWADREQLEEMYRRGELHPLIDYIDILE